MGRSQSLTGDAQLRCRTAIFPSTNVDMPGTLLFPWEFNCPGSRIRKMPHVSLACAMDIFAGGTLFTSRTLASTILDDLWHILESSVIYAAQWPLPFGIITSPT